MDMVLNLCRLLVGRSDERIAAMHALSDLLGASRIDEECSTSNARLNTEAEDRLSDDIFSCAATTSLADTLSLRLKQPFEECRIAALRCDFRSQTSTSWCGITTSFSVTLGLAWPHCMLKFGNPIDSNRGASTKETLGLEMQCLQLLFS